MMLHSKREGDVYRYTLVIDESERRLINVHPGDREFIANATKSPLVSEKLCGLALIAKRIEEGRQVAQALEKSQMTQPPPPSGN